MRTAYKFRLYPNANQARELGVMLETHRRLHNRCLEMRQIAHGYGLNLSAIDQAKWFSFERKNDTWLKRITYTSGQTLIRSLERSFIEFFKRSKTGAGSRSSYPKHKHPDKFNLIEFQEYNSGLGFRGEKLHVLNVGKIRCKKHRDVVGVIKTAAIKREAGKWFVILFCDLGDMGELKASSNCPVGIDLGLESFLTTSSGEQVRNPRFHEKILPDLRRAYRSFRRKKKGGYNRKKSARNLAKVHLAAKNSRRDNHHKVALSLNIRYGLIAVECLNIQGMLKNRRLARSIQDAGWGQFIEILKNKSKKYGVRVVEVDPAYTSQDCPQCGKRVAKTLAQRWHSCSCGLSVHRDVASAQEILRRALKVLQAGTQPVGANVEVVKLSLPKKPL